MTSLMLLTECMGDAELGAEGRPGQEGWSTIRQASENLGRSGQHLSGQWGQVVVWVFPSLLHCLFNYILKKMIIEVKCLA
jgi:hypothetical protein